MQHHAYAALALALSCIYVNHITHKENFNYYSTVLYLEIVSGGGGAKLRVPRNKGGGGGRAWNPTVLSNKLSQGLMNSPGGQKKAMGGGGGGGRMPKCAPALSFFFIFANFTSITAFIKIKQNVYINILYIL